MKKMEERDGKKEDKINSKENSRCERVFLVEIRSLVSPPHMSGNSPLAEILI
jgi:hypothetical protein